MPKISSMEECHIECYSDAFFANLSGGGSQGGIVVSLGDNSGSRCPIFWQSRKIKRVVKSTLSAETMAGAECAVYLSRIMQEISGCGRLKIKCLGDNKSLVEALHSCKTIDDKRLRIDIAVLRDMLERNKIVEVTWVETSQQLADCLTIRAAENGNLPQLSVGRDANAGAVCIGLHMEFIHSTHFECVLRGGTSQERRKKEDEC